MKQFTISERNTFLFESPSASDLLIQPTGDHEIASLEEEMQMIQALRPERPFTLAAFEVNDWNRELSPWKAPAVFGDEGFGEGGRDTLDFVLDSLLPHLRSSFSFDEQRIFLGGYSLAGLFSLWTGYQTDVFRGIAAVSPSVWFPGWIDFASLESIRADRVYLSLGDREMKTRNPVMATVGDCIRQQYDLLASSDICDCTLEWNPGNHFKDTAERTAKGFAWILGEHKR